MERIDWIKSRASHCKNCENKACQFACPLNNNIPELTKCINEERYEDAYRVLCETTVLPAVCGRICPHDRQCQGGCARSIGDPVKIGSLEAFIGDMSIAEGWKIKGKKRSIGKKVAVIGGGPAGLTCAAFLAKSGASVTIYEKHDYLGGLLRHGIPEFRLKKDILDATIQKILDLGIEVQYEKELGHNLSIDDLKSEYDAVFLGVGANVSSRLDIDGSKLYGVLGGNETLEKEMHPNYLGKTVVVYGGGNVAMDVARSIKRLGASKVVIVYRRTKDEMPADKKEIEDAIKDGVLFLFSSSIVKITGNKKVQKIECVKTKTVMENDVKNLINVEGSDFSIKTDYVVTAIGSGPDKFVKKLGLELDDSGKIKIDRDYKTSNDKIYAGGDVTHTIGTVAWAAKTGRIAALNILKSFE